MSIRLLLIQLSQLLRPSKPSDPTPDSKNAYKVEDAVWNNGNECSSAKVWPATKYEMDQETISYFSELVARENCRSNKKDDTVIFGCRLLATQIINLYEERKHDRGGKEGCSGGACYYKDMKKWVTSDQWYHANKSHDLHPGTYSNSNSTQAVIDVIVNGNRALPKFVNRYDGLYHWTNSSKYGNKSYLGMDTIAEAAAAVPMKTKVKPGERYLWCIERKKTSNSYNGPYNEVFNYDNNYRKAVGM